MTRHRLTLHNNETGDLTYHYYYTATAAMIGIFQRLELAGPNHRVVWGDDDVVEIRDLEGRLLQTMLVTVTEES